MMGEMGAIELIGILEDTTTGRVGRVEVFDGPKPGDKVARFRLTTDHLDEDVMKVIDTCEGLGFRPRIELMRPAEDAGNGTHVAKFTVVRGDSTSISWRPQVMFPEDLMGA
jgi:hypothetical protein